MVLWIRLVREVKLVDKAIGFIETRGTSTAIEAADEMLKQADVTIFNKYNVDPALVTIVVEGDIGAVQIAVDYGTMIAKRTNAFIGSTVIPHPVSEIHKLIIAPNNYAE